MKKEKTLVSKVPFGDFTLSTDTEPLEEKDPFPGFSIPPVKYTGNQEVDARSELEYTRQCLLWVDKHPPQTGDVLDSPIYCCVVFESRKQKNAFLQDTGVIQYADKYVDSGIFAHLFGVDMEHGEPMLGSSADTDGHGFDFDFSFSPEFEDAFRSESVPKKVVGETLLRIREDEKSTAEYLAWAVDPSFWFAICFRSVEHKSNFFKSIGVPLERAGNIDVVWCHDFARPFGIDLQTCTFKPRIFSGRIDKKLAALTWNGEIE